MTTYQGRPNNAKYRKIYEKHYGPLPKDEFGRTYDVHHIDGDHENNSIENLMAVTIQEHYEIHRAQGDWGACYYMSLRMKRSPEEISENSRRAQLERVKNKKHHFQDSEFQRKHALARIEAGLNPVVVDSETARQRAYDSVKNGTHPFLGGKIQSKSNLNRLANGTHPSQKKWTCENCSKTGTGQGNYIRHHGDRCKTLKSAQKT